MYCSKWVVLLNQKLNWRDGVCCSPGISCLNRSCFRLPYLWVTPSIWYLSHPGKVVLTPFIIVCVRTSFRKCHHPMLCRACANNWPDTVRLSIIVIIISFTTYNLKNILIFFELIVGVRNIRFFNFCFYNYFCWV